MKSSRLRPTCLFTSVSLSPDTKKEHAILKALGGRIVSNKVTSDEFNSQCGEKIDIHLANQFKFIMRHLAPVLPSDEKKKKMLLVSEDGQREYILKSGRVDLAKPYKKCDQETGKVIHIIPSKQFNSIKSQLEREAGNGEGAAYAYPISPEDKILFANSSESMSPEGHLASLKCFLVAFDAMLEKRRNIQHEHFTRSAALQPLRDFVANSVMDTTSLDISILNEFYLGIQPDGDSIVKKIADAFPDAVFPPFAHILAVSTYKPYKSILGFWSIFGFEGHTFKLCEHWEDSSFSILIVNPVMGSSSSPRIYHSNIEFPFLLGKSTPYKSFLLAKSASKEQLEKEVLPFLSVVRRDEFYAVQEYVELNTDVCLEMMELDSIINPDIASLEEIAIRRLNSFFEFCIPNEELKSKVSFALDKWGKSAPKEIRNPDFLNDYRLAFKKLITPFSRAGHIFIRSVC